MFCAIMLPGDPPSCGGKSTAQIGAKCSGMAVWTKNSFVRLVCVELVPGTEGADVLELAVWE